MLDLRTWHLVVGGILYNVAIVLCVLGPFAGVRRRWEIFGLCLVQYGLVHLQLSLGLASREDVGECGLADPVV